MPQESQDPAAGKKCETVNWMQRKSSGGNFYKKKNRLSANFTR